MMEKKLFCRLKVGESFCRTGQARQDGEFIKTFPVLVDQKVVMNAVSPLTWEPTLIPDEEEVEVVVEAING